MDILSIKKREIRRTTCGNEGRPYDGEGHRFIIFTRLDYNLKSGCVIGVPLTSKHNNKFILNYGINITNDDVVGTDSPFTKPTFAFCDRMCRVEKSDIHVGYEELKIKEGKLKEIILNFIHFLESGNKLPPDESASLRDNVNSIIGTLSQSIQE